MKKPRGTQDQLPMDIHKWHYVEDVFRDVCTRFGYREIRTPLFEHTALFKRGVGETTDVVSKEMYTVFNSREFDKFIHEKQLEAVLPSEAMEKFLENKQGLTLKPEGTAPVARAFVENKLYADAQPTKLFYNTACSRHERPQAGRFRQFHQFGVEIFSPESAVADAETIAVAHQLMKELGLKNIELNINSVGCPNCRPAYHEKLKSFLSDQKETLCGTCQERFGKNPLRILDCKVESCQEKLVDAPVMIDHLCEDCQKHFEDLKDHLDAMDIPFAVDPKIVRGLDYYTRTAYEFLSGDIGAQSAVCGGGRYNGLVSQIGGPEVPGVGFGMGVERLILTMEASGIVFPQPQRCLIFVGALDEKAAKASSGLVHRLRGFGINADRDHMDRSLKAQMKYANKIDAHFTLVLGSDEMETGQATLKNMEDGSTETVAWKETENLAQKLKAYMNEEREASACQNC